MTGKFDTGDRPDTQPACGNAQDGVLSLEKSHLAFTDATLRNLFFLAPTALLLTDPESARPLAASRHALQLLGLSTENASELRTSDFWDDPAEREAFVRQVREDGFVRALRVRLRRTDGTRFWARLSARAIEHEGRAAVISNFSDVTDIVAAEEVLHRTQQTLSTLLEASPFPLIVTRLDNGLIRYCNRKAADMFETPLSGLVGHTAPEFYVEPSDRTSFVEKLRSDGAVEGFVARLKTGSGQPFWAILNAKTLELNGEPVFMVAFADVTKQKDKEAELEHLAFKDGLTNAYNRRYFIEAARMELARAERGRQQPTLALIDIDHFKRLNDTHGHETGDEVLREFVRMVQGELRRSDIFARYGGEEFAILFPETASETACEIVERIRRIVAGHVFSQGSRVTFSGGLVEATADADYHELMQSADASLYEAKRAGRNRIRTTAR